MLVFITFLAYELVCQKACTNILFSLLYTVPGGICSQRLYSLKHSNCKCLQCQYLYITQYEVMCIITQYSGGDQGCTSGATAPHFPVTRFPLYKFPSDVIIRLIHLFKSFNHVLNHSNVYAEGIRFCNRVQSPS